MRRAFPNALAASAIAVALAACAGSSEPPQPTADELARATYTRIIDGANAVTVGDQLGYYGTDDEIERVGARCLVDVCSVAFSRTTLPSSFSVESEALKLDLLGDRRGVSLVVEEASLSSADVHVYGGWLDHSLFASESVLLTGERWPDRGARVVYNYSVGFSTGENPRAVDGSARWEGLMIGRDMRASPSRGQVIRGAADVTLELGGSGVTADVAFTGIANIETGELWDDMAWRVMAVEQGGFERRNAPDYTISGRFYGPDEEEVGGVFERSGAAGVFGGRRVSE